MLSDGLIDSADKMTDIDLADGQELHHAKSLTAFEGSLALLSVIIGGGIVGIPYAMYSAGVLYGIILTLISPILAFTSGYLFMTCKLMAPIKLETLYELGYFTMGKSSIYFISFIAIVCNDGFCMIYFIVFGGCAASIV
jgi:amino acid permease